MTPSRIDFLGLPLDAGVTLADVCRRIGEKSGPEFVTFINPSSWALARSRPEFPDMLRQMTLVLPDGIGVAAACRFLTGLECPRISFDASSLADPFFRTAAEKKATILLVGGAPGVDEQMLDKLQDNWPGLKLTGSMHGYGGLAPKVRSVMDKAPDIVIAGMGGLRQERFLLDLAAAGYTGLAITCGGFFDQYLENARYYPRWIDRWNLRFAWRLFKEPKRLGRRYLIDYRIFIGLVLKAAWSKKIRPLFSGLGRRTHLT